MKRWIVAAALMCASVSFAADAPATKRLLARTDLARFYLARDMIYEAKAVLDVAIADQPPTAENPSAVVLRAVCNIMIGRADMGLKDLASPFVGNQNDAQLWRALAYAKLGKWPEAREGFRAVEAAIGTLPLELQRNVMKEMIRAYVEVGDGMGGSLTGLSRDSDLWRAYSEVAPAHPHFAMRRVGDSSQIFSVFHELFAKGGVRA